MFDLRITGASIVDGTGRTAVTGDIAIAEGRIAQVGGKAGAARRTIDASGAIVTPGFVDVHTHYDGQVSWDPELTPSSLHGVTTCVLGNCGVGFAPVHRGREDALVELMEGVEDIPGSALAEGIPWGWTSFGEYMTAIDAMPHAIEFAVQVPHDPLRMFVMGERAIAGEPASADDVAKMRALLAEALAAGAAGFSTGRTDNHRTATGAATPASEAAPGELAGIVGAFDDVTHGVLQAVSDFDMAQGPAHFEREIDLLEQMAVRAKRPLSVSTMQRDHAPDQWRRILARAEQATARGIDMRCQVGARAIGVILGLETTFHPFVGFPSYKAIAHLPLAERVARMQDPAVRARMLAEKSDRLAGDGSAVPPLADFFLAHPELVAMRLFRMDEVPDYEPAPDSCLAAEAARTNTPILALIYDALIADGGRALLYFPIYNYASGSLSIVREMLVHPRALLGLGDAGAHVGTVCDASMPTFLLAHWTRRPDGLTLERAVQMQTHDTARYLGLGDRGTLAVGMRADLNLIDRDRLALPRPEIRRDLPAGGKRLFQAARGYLATIVGGEVIAEHGALTGVRPGRLVRMGRAAVTRAAMGPRTPARGDVAAHGAVS